MFSVTTLGRIKTGARAYGVYNKPGIVLLGEIGRKEIDGLSWQVEIRPHRVLNGVLRNLNFVF